MESEEIGLDEFLNEMERVESVVGVASGTECTYKDGYMERQAVFSCLDCTPASSPASSSSDLRAGFCFACSLACHKDHNVEEIYTKRRFRCDCGTLPQLLCSLKPDDVDARNAANKYSQNFAGLYCECSRPYPDSETPELDNVEMLQCFVCEDWFHTTHIHVVVPESFEEMTCAPCAGKHPFLAVYALLAVEDVDIDGVDSNTVCPVSAPLLVPNCNSESTSPDTNKLHDSKHVSTKIESTTSAVKLSESKPETSNASTNDDSNKVNMKRPLSETLESSPTRSSKRKRSNGCKLNGWSEEDTNKGVKSALFFDEHFRDNVCKCDACLELYKSHDITFLPDPSDTLLKYEERARVKRQNEEDELSNTLENLPHQAKCEVARAIGSLHNTLDGLLSKIAQEGKDAVGRQEIMEAFKAMAAETNVDPSIFDKLGK